MATSEDAEAWSAVAGGWARWRGFIWEATSSVSERLVELLDPRPGETILELAAGAGDTGFLAAERIGSEGRLISTDVAEDMVQAARRRAAEIGVDNVEFATADAQALELQDASVDGVVCRWGYMLMPNPTAALAESRRVLRPGGRVAFAVWAEPERNPWGTAAGRALVELGLMERPDPNAPGPFRLGDERRLLEVVADAELDVVHSGEVDVTWRSPGFEHWWTVQSDLSRLISSTIAELDAEDVQRFRMRTAEQVASYASGDGSLALPGVARVVLARRRPT